MPNQHQLLSKKEVESFTTLSSAQIDRLERAGLFPRRLRLSTRRVAWYAGEVSEWLNRSRETDIRGK
ncbi:AlpA family phage regulatory protein [Microvirga aerilata]|uniref:AlpA family phage regulatory protein n=1 Tax=Microvirga aerilata TaxID=670292 RepID=A0A937D1M3_9HYPH|nr:AlpA family phage regulatory protein [Microvirga aerilata]